MVTKIYKAPNTIISRMTVIIDNKPRMVSFLSVTAFGGVRTGRGSVLETNDEKLQEALETSPSFGRTFFLAETKNYIEGADVAKAFNGNDDNHSKDGEQTVKEVVHIKVDTPADARDYLQEHFGIKPNSVLKKDRIDKVALENGVIFDWE